MTNLPEAEGRLRPQRAATAKAASPFFGTSHVSLRWNVATVSVPTAEAVLYWFPAACCHG